MLIIGGMAGVFPITLSLYLTFLAIAFSGGMTGPFQCKLAFSLKPAALYFIAAAYANRTGF